MTRHHLQVRMVNKPCHTTRNRVDPEGAPGHQAQWGETLEQLRWWWDGRLEGTRNSEIRTLIFTVFGMYIEIYVLRFKTCKYYVFGLSGNYCIFIWIQYFNMCIYIYINMSQTSREWQREEHWLIYLNDSMVHQLFGPTWLEKSLRSKCWIQQW